jgi:hypothetical protein
LKNNSPFGRFLQQQVAQGQPVGQGQLFGAGIGVEAELSQSCCNRFSLHQASQGIDELLATGGEPLSKEVVKPAGIPDGGGGGAGGEANHGRFHLGGGLESGGGHPADQLAIGQILRPQAQSTIGFAAGAGLQALGQLFLHQKDNALELPNRLGRGSQYLFQDGSGEVVGNVGHQQARLRGQRQAKKIPFHQVEAGLVGEALSQQPAQIPVDLHRHHLDTLGQQSPRQLAGAGADLQHPSGIRPSLQIIQLGSPHNRLVNSGILEPMLTKPFTRIGHGGMFAQCCAATERYPERLKEKWPGGSSLD